MRKILDCVIASTPKSKKTATNLTQIRFIPNETSF